VQLASKATKRPREGCTTNAGSPVLGSVNDAAPPTGTPDAGPIRVPIVVEAVVGGAALVGGLAVVGAVAAVVGPGRELVGVVVGAVLAVEDNVLDGEDGGALRMAALTRRPPGR
jgi:hypothetical protein